MSAVLNNHEQAVYLKPQVKLEPLVCRWYAWSHLIAPAQLALHITYRILPLMQSFAANPDVHVSANADPNMYGGPFMSLGADDVGRLQQLIEQTHLQCADLIALATDLRALDAALQEKANGYSLNEYYASLPASLQGLVELLYDINHHASIRLFEGLMYDEAGMGANLQEIMMYPVDERDRHFFMSTPRLDTPDSMSFKMRFADPRLDQLAAMRATPRAFGEVAELFGVDSERLPTFRAFFTEQAPAPANAPDYQQAGVRMRYFGHACVLFQSAEVAVLFDPFVSVEPGSDGRMTINDLPEFIDYVVLTHSHQDHFSPEMLIQLRHRIGRVIVPANNSGNTTDPSMKLVLKELGFERIDVLDVFDSVALPDGELISLPFTGEHADLSIYSKHAVALKLKGRQFLFLVDSDGRDRALYERLMRRLGKVDALFIGMECHGAPLNWLYEPLLGKPINRRNNESRRLSGLDCERAWSILGAIQAPRVFVYAMGQEPWMKYIMGLEYQPDSVQLTESDQLVARCRAAGITAERLFCSSEVQF